MLKSNLTISLAATLLLAKADQPVHCKYYCLSPLPMPEIVPELSSRFIEAPQLTF